MRRPVFVAFLAASVLTLAASAFAAPVEEREADVAYEAILSSPSTTSDCVQQGPGLCFHHGVSASKQKLI